MKYLGWCQILESVLKDVDITDRRLQNMIMNGSMSKRFQFLDEFSSLTLRFTMTWPIIIKIWCAPQSSKTSRAMRNETVYIPVCKHWSGRRLQGIKQNTILILKKNIFFLILTKMIEVGLKFRRNHHLRYKHHILHIPQRKHPRERWLQWINWEEY